MRPVLAATAALAVIAAPLAAWSAPGLEVLSPWSRPAVAGSNAVGYMTLANHGRTADELVRVECPLAARVEMHSSAMSGGVMSMQRQDTVTVPAGGEARFAPGAYHLMLIGLTRTLKAGDKVPVTLSFASGRRLQAALAVSEGMGPPTPAQRGHKP